MSRFRNHFRAKWHDTAARVFKSVSDTGKLTHTSLLTYPGTDLAGDYVVGSGCDFAPHQIRPEVDFEHRRHPMVKGMPVAWARESLSEPGAPYAVKRVSLNFADEGRAPEFHVVPVGTEYFDKSCPVSMQVFALRESGALPASSLEFEMLPQFTKSIGWSELEGRSAYRFEKCKVHRWTVCARGVNEGALTLTKSLTQVPAELAKVLRDRRVNVGGKFEPLHGYILKALATDAPRPRSTVRVEKAMDDEYDDQPTPDADPQLETQEMAAVETPPEDDGVAHNGVTALYAHADGIVQLCDQLDSDLEKTDSAELYKEGQKLCEMARALAEKVKAAGDKHDAKLQAMKGRGEEPAEPAEGGEADESADMSTDDDDDEEGGGTFKAVRGAYKPILKALRVKRFKAADIDAALAAAPEPEPFEPEPEPADFIEQYKNDPAVARELKRARILN